MKDKEKPSFASLNPSLLARKGGARPAMRPQLQPLPGAHSGQPLEDLGWNDMGHGEEEARHADPLPLTPAPASPETGEKIAAETSTEVHRQQEAIAERLREGDEVAQEVAQAPLDQAPLDRNAAKEAAPETVAKSAPAPKPAKRTARPRRSNGHALAKGKRAAFTLRLDQSRHLKLRLACTMNNRSAQQIVTEALDSFLGEIPELDSLAAKVKRH